MNNSPSSRRHAHHTAIAVVSVAVAVALIVAAGIFADALPPVVATVGGGIALIAFIVMIAAREEGR